MCFESFTGKAPPPQKRPVFPDVEAEVEGWSFQGPLLIAEDGPTFFTVIK